MEIKMQKRIIGLLVMSIGVLLSHVGAEEIPSRVWTEEGTITTTVMAINQKTREITLKGPEGDPMTIEAGPDVKNFDQIKKGDQIVSKYVETVELSVRKPGEVEASKPETAVEVESAAKGEKPGASLAGTMEITATVTAIDHKKRTMCPQK
jgi:hypothetical protein